MRRHVVPLALMLTCGVVVAACGGDGGLALEVDEPPLVYVALGDSTTFNPTRSTGLISVYAEMLERDFGIGVDLRDHTSGFGGSAGLLSRLRTNETLREDLADAHVVTIQISTHGWEPNLIAAAGDDPVTDCGGDDGRQCLRDYLAEHKADIEAIFAELTAICDPSDVLIRAQDTYTFNVTWAKAEGKLGIYNPIWREAQEYIEEVAEGYEIPVAQVYDEFMGPDGTDDPRERGLMLDNDITHPSEAGATLMAEMIHDLGYDVPG